MCHGRFDLFLEAVIFSYKFVILRASRMRRTLAPLPLRFAGLTPEVTFCPFPLAMFLAHPASSIVSLIVGVPFVSSVAVFFASWTDRGLGLASLFPIADVAPAVVVGHPEPRPSHCCTRRTPMCLLDITRTPKALEHEVDEH